MSASWTWNADPHGTMLVEELTMTNAYVVTGTLTDASTVKLDEPLPLSGGTVRVVVEATATTMPPGSDESLKDFLDRLHRQRAETGVAPLTTAQIDEWVADIASGRGR